MFCENCGAKMPDNAKFCGGCGQRVGEPLKGSAPVTPPPPPPQEQRAYTPPPAPPQQNPFREERREANPSAYAMGALSAPLTMGQYLVMFLLMGIPLVGLILLLMWAFGSNANINKKNFARASLVLSLIAIVLWVAIGGIIASLFMNTFRGGYYY